MALLLFSFGKCRDQGAENLSDENLSYFETQETRVMKLWIHQVKNDGGGVSFV